LIEYTTELIFKLSGQEGLMFKVVLNFLKFLEMSNLAAGFKGEPEIIGSSGGPALQN